MIRGEPLGAVPPLDANRGADPWGALWPLLGRHIAFHRRLVDVTASVKAAVLLSQAIYWTRHGRDIDRSGGWFSKTVREWELETGLSEREQATVREALRQRELLLEERRGLPARLHFRLCVDRLVQALAIPADGVGVPVGARSAVVLGHLLGPAFAYHRILTQVTHGVHQGLLLSRALQLARQDRHRSPEGWIQRTSRQWTEDLGLTRREQETARRVLSGLGLWEEAAVGTPPRLAARVRVDTLLATIVGRVPSARSDDARRALYGEDLATGPAQNVGSVVADLLVLDPTKPPQQIRRNRHDRSDENAIPLIQGSTGVSVQPLQTPGACEALASVGRGGGALIFPERLHPEEREAARVLLDPVRWQAQAILDELAARLQANAVRSSPVAYLRGLVQRAREGTFVPEAGVAITAARRHREQEASLREAQLQAERDLAAERARPEFQSKLAQRRAEMQRWLGGRGAPRREGGRS